MALPLAVTGGHSERLAAIAKTDAEQFVRLAKRLRSGELTPDDWADQFSKILVHGHARAWELGRRLSGDLSPFGFRDLLMGRAAMDAETEFFTRIADQVGAGDFDDDDGQIDDQKLSDRSRLYTGRYRGTANEAWTETGPDDALYDWEMTAIEHCRDCPRLAAASPYAKDELFAWPGSNDTECLFNCKCRLIRRGDGTTGFEPFEQ